MNNKLQPHIILKVCQHKEKGEKTHLSYQGKKQSPEMHLVEF